MARARGRRSSHPDPADLPGDPSRRRPPCPAGQPSGVRQGHDPVPQPGARHRPWPARSRHRALAPSAQGRPARVPAGGADARGEHTAVAAARLASRWRALPVGAIVDVEHDMMTCALEIVGASLFGSTGRRRPATWWMPRRRGCEPSSRAPATRSPCRWRCRPWQPPAWLPSPGWTARSHRWSRPGGRRRRRGTARGHARRAARRWLALDQRGPRPGGDVHRRRARDRGQRAHLVLVRAGGAAVGRRRPGGRGAAMAPAGVTEARGARQCGAPDLASAVFDESLRLYPPGWLITRKALTDDVVGGHVIPAGALVLISPTWSTATPPQFPRTGPPGPAGLIPSVSIPLASWRIRRRRSTAATSPSAPARGCASGARWRAPRAPWCSLRWPGSSGWIRFPADRWDATRW